jgi:hypothetical protein
MINVPPTPNPSPSKGEGDRSTADGGNAMTTSAKVLCSMDRSDEQQLRD